MSDLMAMIRRWSSSGDGISQATITLTSVNRGAFIAMGAMGAMGLSLGAAWAYQRSHRQREGSCENVSCGGVKAKAHKRSRHKRHKSVKAVPVVEAVPANMLEEDSTAVEVQDMGTHDTETATTAVCSTPELSHTTDAGATNVEPRGGEADALTVSSCAAEATTACSSMQQVTVAADDVHAVLSAATSSMGEDMQSNSSWQATMSDGVSSGDWISVACKQRRRRLQTAPPEVETKTLPKQVDSLVDNTGGAVSDPAAASVSVPDPIVVPLRDAENQTDISEGIEVGSSLEPSPAEGSVSVGVDGKPSKPRRPKKKKRPPAPNELLTTSADICRAGTQISVFLPVGEGDCSNAFEDDTLPTLPWAPRSSKPLELDELVVGADSITEGQGHSITEGQTQMPDSCQMDVEGGGSEGGSSSGDAQLPALEQSDEWQLPPAEAQQSPQEWVEVKRKRGKRPAAGKPRTSE